MGDTIQSIAKPKAPFKQSGGGGAELLSTSSLLTHALGVWHIEAYKLWPLRSQGMLCRIRQL